MSDVREPLLGDNQKEYRSVERQSGGVRFRKRSKWKLFTGGLGVIALLGVAAIATLGVLGYFSPSESPNSEPDKPILQLSGFYRPCQQWSRFWKVQNHSLGEYATAAVAADDQRCSKIGREILEKNGSAADSAIATLLCLGVVHPHNSGIGGGFFLVYYERVTKKITAFDSREVAPLAANATMFTGNPTASSTGGLSIAVPSEVAGYIELHKRYGKLPWADLFQPAITLAREGFESDAALSREILGKIPNIFIDPELRKLFFNSTSGSLNLYGGQIVMPKLADTLEQIAADPQSFYTGELAKRIVADIQQAGGIVNETDLKDYKVNVEAPLVGELNGMKLHSMQPPASGALLQFILNILKGYDFGPEHLSSLNETALTYHRIVESFKFAFGKRPLLGDKDFVDVEKIVKDLLNQTYADDHRTLISDATTYTSDYYYGTVSTPTDGGTTHLSIVAPNGDAVSVTSTINTKFGSKVVGNRTGIFFNNEMDDFSTPNSTNTENVPASEANYIEPGKRPLSSMCPVIVTDSNDELFLVSGGAGGTKITTALTWATVHSLWFNMTLKEAIDTPRLHHQLWPSDLSYECVFNKTILTEIEKFGHNTTLLSSDADVQAVMRVGNTWQAYSDWREGGLTDGW